MIQIPVQEADNTFTPYNLTRRALEQHDKKQQKGNYETPDHYKGGVQLGHRVARQRKHLVRANTTGSVRCGCDLLLNVLRNEVCIFV